MHRLCRNNRCKSPGFRRLVRRFTQQVCRNRHAGDSRSFLVSHTDSAVLHLPASASARRRASCLRTGNRLPLRLLPHLQPYTFIRKDGKLCIKRFSLAGTGGQCLLTPPERPLEDIPTTLYNLGGVLANLLTAILAFLPLLTVDGLPYLLKFFLLMLSLIGILLAGMNGIPMKMGGIGNDADNMCLLLKDSKSKQALVTQLRINALVQEGMRPKDMPAEWFSQTEDINYKDALQVTIALMSASRLLDCEEWEAAYNAFEKIMSHRHEVIGLLIKETACELLFTALVTKRTARAEELYTDELDTYIRQYKDVTSSKQRLLCALALYRDKDTAKAKEIYEATCQRKNKYLMQGEVSSDIALMKSILTAKNAL